MVIYTWFASFEIRLRLTALPVDMEHWHVPYNYPRGDNVQAWLLKTLEGAISRESDRECDWMFKQRCVAQPMGLQLNHSCSAAV